MALSNTTSAAGTRNDPARHSQGHKLPVGKWTLRAVRVPGIVRMVMRVLVGVCMRMGVPGRGVIVRVLMRMSGIVAVTPRAMVMMVPVRVSMARQAATKHVEPEEGDGKPGGDAEPGVEMVRHNILRRVERDEPQRVDPGGVCDGHDQTEEQGMGGRSLRPHQVGRHDGFSVSRLKRVQTS